jgi:hypothetical protein
MADGVRAHLLVGQRWHFGSCLFRVPFDHGIDTETGYRMATAIQENSIRRRTIHDERSDGFHGCGPQGTLPLFAAFSDDPHK